MLWLQFTGLTLCPIEQRQQLRGQALGGLLAERQGFHQHRQLVFQPPPQPGGEGIFWRDLPGPCCQCPAHSQAGLFKFVE